LFIQICGRIRNSNYNNEITHIFNTTRYNEFANFDEFEQKTNEERTKTLKWLDAINKMDEDSRLKTIKLVEKNNIGLNEMYISRIDDKLELDENLINLDIFNYKITNHLYSARITLSNEYAKNGFNVLRAQYTQYEVTDKLKKNNKAKVSFKDLFIEYAALKAKEPMFNFNFGNTNERLTLIEQEKPLVQEAYLKLGIEKVKALKYNVSNVKNAISKIEMEQQTDIGINTKIVQLLTDKGIKTGE